ncbi:RloB family protein [uncultured Pedobacter sp.]|uniref:RloB family protein n=1 Tax=uncultured Pedobacter sp. TaxID=246139 RepID=UPI0025EA571F|nr:RloB family protein [uncultured Pedobacter sp.]
MRAKITEPSYFNQFKLASATVEALGKGYNTLACVKHAIHLSQKKKYDQIWCVFDKDDFPNSDFNDAIKLAKTNGLKVAYSNMSFEYWMILHFDDHQGGGMHRSRYDEVINKHLKPFHLEYEGEDSKLVTQDIFDVLMSKGPKTETDRVLLAIERAKRNYELFDHTSPANEESSTTVFELVDELLKYKN